MTHPDEAGGPPVLALDIGGTGISAAVIGTGGAQRPTHTERAPTPAADGPDAVLATAVRLARAALREAGTGGAAVTSVGLGTAGVVGPDGRTVTHATDALPGWAGTSVADRLESALALPVTVLGDVQAFLVGEAVAGAARGAGCAVGVMAGTGIGGAVWTGREVLRGAHGAAGHLGHVPVPEAAGLPCPCGRTGHVEAVASGPAITQRFQRAHPELPVESLRDVAALAAEGSAAARAALTDGGRALGIALGGIASTLDPDVVVLAGGVLRSGPWYAAGLREALPTATLPSLARLRVVPALLGSGAVLAGAAHAARHPRHGANEGNP